MKKKNYIDEAGAEWTTQSDKGLSILQHTPTPWTLQEGYIESSDMRVLFSRGKMGDRDRWMNDAAYIVRAVNAH